MCCYVIMTVVTLFASGLLSIFLLDHLLNNYEVTTSDCDIQDTQCDVILCSNSYG